MSGVQFRVSFDASISCLMHYIFLENFDVWAFDAMRYTSYKIAVERNYRLHEIRVNRKLDKSTHTRL